MGMLDQVLPQLDPSGFTRSAAHKDDRAAGESPVRDETNVSVVITDLRLERSSAGKLGRKRPVQSGTSKMTGRSIKSDLKIKGVLSGKD